MRDDTRQLFVDVFNEELAKYPSVPPSPLRLNQRLGLGSQTSLRGDLAKLRSELLAASGFEKRRGRWVKV